MAPFRQHLQEELLGCAIFKLSVLVCLQAMCPEFVAWQTQFCQKILATSLLCERSSLVRIRSVNRGDWWCWQVEKLGDEVKAANKLIAKLQEDEDAHDREMAAANAKVEELEKKGQEESAAAKRRAEELEEENEQLAAEAEEGAHAVARLPLAYRQDHLQPGLAEHAMHRLLPSLVCGLAANPAAARVWCPCADPRHALPAAASQALAHSLPLKERSIPRILHHMWLGDG